MEKSHRANVLVTSCLKTPVDPHTKVPLALYERERAAPCAAGHPPDNRNYEKQVRYDSDSDLSDAGPRGGEGRGPAPGQNRGAPGPMGPMDLLELCSSNQEYCRRLEALRRAHLHTMGQLERMYRTQLGLKAPGPAGGQAGGPSRWQSERSGVAVRELRKAFSAVELSPIRGGGLSDSSEEEEEGVANHDSAKTRGRSLPPSARERIRTMWENFTVGELAPRDRRPESARSQSEGQGGGKGRGRGRARAEPEREGESERDTWRHRCTVPRPFQMTLREADRKRRGVRSRAHVELESDLLRKELAELAECQRKFRASPVPAHVYLPLYEELAARNQERTRRRRSPRRVSQKPSAVLERERERKEARVREQPRREEGEAGRMFRAKPVPRSVYDSTVSERMKEDQLYRAIKMQMRSRELLQSASLPRSMLGRPRRNAKRGGAGEREEEEEARTEADFRPRINGEVPDFEAGYRRFREQLQSRREERPTTACEPFRLRTADVRQRRQRSRSEAEAGPYAAPSRPPTSDSSLSSSLSASLEHLRPARTTDAARKRQEAVRRVLEERRKAEEEEETRRRGQKRRVRRLQSVISKRALANDPHTALALTRTAKLRQLRKQDLQRRKEFREEMREMEERVRGRPLLLEQVTQRNARQVVERRYADALHALGLSEDLVLRLAPDRTQGPQGRGEPRDQASVSSQEEQRGQEDRDPESCADYYPDDYEELDDPGLSGEEKGEEEDHRGGDDEDAEEEEDEEEDCDHADQDVD
ncbi:protein FAM161A [Conger conger]|uniref:protein FAM161A n=1 Tax=Conger conger TaxID=82655 RepID=UPI002A5B083E|nr:protein FAM161A [Conger conger]